MSLRCVLWCAVSTPAQANDDRFSLPKQEADARAVCEQHGWQIIDVLSIPGHSRYYHTIADAANEMRRAGIDALDRFMAHIERADFDVLMVRDTDRFGRTPSMLNEVMQRTYQDAGAKVYTLAGGMIENHERIVRSTFAGMMTATDIERLVQYRHAGMRAKIPRGIPVHRPPFSHVLIRDGRGKITGMKPDENVRGVIEDAARLLVEGVGWKYFEHELHQRYGHINPASGKAYADGTFHKLFYNPVFWGNNAYGTHANQRPRIGLWCFDPAEPPPAHVDMFYSTHDAALTGDLAGRVQAEMRRRYESVRGRARPYGTTVLSGLLLCAGCGRRMVYTKPTRRNVEYYICSVQKGIKGRCDNRKHARVDSLKTQISELLEAIMQGSDLTAVLIPPQDDTADQLRRVDSDIDAVQHQAAVLVRQLAINPGLGEIIQAELDTKEAQLTRLQQRRDALAGQTRAVTTAQQGAAERLRGFETTAAFWARPDLAINQDLHALLGAWRLVVSGGRIVGIRIP